jgi:hypothetical protein
MCGKTGATKKVRVNKDIDFTRTVGSKLTLDMDYEVLAASEDEQDVYALARNLYSPNTFEPKDEVEVKKYGSLYKDLRSKIAMRNVAHNSYVNIVAERSSAKAGNGADSGWNFMKALLSDFGIPDAEIHQMMGKYPSYYAQMDVLTKKMYQNPEFYTNLYDKPVNVRRMSASMEAIKLMQARDQYKTALRREILLSMMVEQEIAPQVSAMNAKLK